MRHIITLFLVISMFSAQASPKTKPVKKAETDLIQRAHERVQSIMKDPESARFKNDFIGKDDAICGSVNGKNSLGGYGGFQRYIVETDRVLIESNDSREAWKMDSRWLDLCSEFEKPA